MELSEARYNNSDNAADWIRDWEHNFRSNPPDLEIYLSLGSAFSFMFNASTREIKVLSPEVKSVLGYDINDLKKPLFLSFVRKIHPSDVQPYLLLLRKIRECLNDQKECNSDDLKLLLDFRVKHAKGKYVRLLLQTEVRKLQSSAKDEVWIGLASDISFLKMDGDFSFNCLNEKFHQKFLKSDFTASKSTGLFSDREREVLKLLAKGYNSRRIQETLHISQHTVRTHRRNMHKKCKVENTAQLIKLATREGYI